MVFLVFTRVVLGEVHDVLLQPRPLFAQHPHLIFQSSVSRLQVSYLPHGLHVLPIHRLVFLVQLLQIDLFRCVEGVHQVTQFCLDFSCNFELFRVTGRSFDSFFDFLYLSFY